MMSTWLLETRRKFKQTLKKTRIVRQVGYLQRLYQDARSTKHTNHETACTSLPEDEQLDVRNMSKTPQLN